MKEDLNRTNIDEEFNKMNNYMRDFGNRGNMIINMSFDSATVINKTRIPKTL